MVTKQTVKEALAAIGVPTNAKADNISKSQQRLIKAAPLYLTDEQAAVILEAGKMGWTGRSIVVDVKSRLCAISIEAGDHVAWVKPDGTVEAEEVLVKLSGVLGGTDKSEVIAKH